MKNRILEFLKKLRRDNSREWLAEHKDEYQQVMAERDDIARRFINAISTVDPTATNMAVGQSG